MNLEQINLPRCIMRYINYTSILKAAFEKLDYPTIKYIHDNKLVDSHYFTDQLNWMLAYTSPKNEMVLFLQNLGYKHDKKEVEKIDKGLQGY